MRASATIDMKDNSQLTSYLNEYLEMTRPQFAVMISGKWGCGKTYYIQERIKEWSKSKGKVGPDQIELKPIYISVNGISTISSVIRLLKQKLYPLLYSKGAAVAKKIALSTLQILTKSKVDLDGDGLGEDLRSFFDAEGILEIFKSDNSVIKGNRVLVFDDLERCRIPLDELFGFINGIVEHTDSKVILVCDEVILKRVTEQENLKVKYDEFKEKLIGQTFFLAVDYSSITRDFIDATKNHVLTDNRDLIIEIFMASKCENLRLARHGLLDIMRFFEQLPKEINKNPNYKAFTTNVVAYLTISSIETRLGNASIHMYQAYGFSEEEKKVNQAFEAKYNKILERHKIYSSAYTIPVKDLVRFIQTGYIEAPEQLVFSCRMLHSRNLTDWEKLWWCDKLSNEEFLTVLKKEKERFYNNKLEFVFEVAHLAGILLSLERRGLVKLSRKHVVSVAKRNIADIYKNYPNEEQRTMVSRQGYEFQELNTPEMEEIISFACSLRQKRQDKKGKEYVRAVWNSLDSNMTCEKLNQKFDELTPARRGSYSQESIFTQISPDEMAKKIIALPNGAKMEFAFFLIDRYYLEGSGDRATIYDEMKADKPNLMKLSSLLKRRAKRLKLLDKEKTVFIANKIDEAVAKM